MSSDSKCASARLACGRESIYQPVNSVAAVHEAHSRHEQSDTVMSAVRLLQVEHRLEIFTLELEQLDLGFRRPKAGRR